MNKLLLFSSLCIFMVACGAKKTNLAPIAPINDTKFELTFFPQEVRPAKSLPCFAGAYYRKFVSSDDNWIGIKGEVILPQLHFDSLRMNPVKPKQFLDVSSIYMGGNMDGQETDIGLAWEIIRDARGEVSQERLSFRPFLRRTGHRTGQKSIYINAPARQEFYWQPGDTVFMAIEVVRDGVLSFVVQGAGKKYETTFECAGYTLNGIGEFKRVNAIDQVANEGKAAQQTHTTLEGARWNFTNLIRMENGRRIEVPMHSGRATEMLCPDAKYFDIQRKGKDAELGAEYISITGNK